MTPNEMCLNQQCARIAQNHFDFFKSMHRNFKTIFQMKVDQLTDLIEWPILIHVF